MSVKICTQCNQEFQITDADRRFYKKMSIPDPVCCSTCRMQRRMTFRNERKLYKSKCGLSGKEIISIYPPNSPYKIYDQSKWWGDSWDAMDFGRDFNFSRPFFEQFHELTLEVPRINLQNRSNENSDYCNDCDYMKNCYLCFNSYMAEDCYYCNTFGEGSKNCADMFWSLACELCYECTKMHHSYHCFWCANGKNLNDCYFCEECQACKNCFGCVGLRQKQYCVYNKQLNQIDYENFIRDFKFTHPEVEAAKQKIKELGLQVPHKNLQIHQSENCLGDYIRNSKNCIECFDVFQSENCKYVWDGMLSNCYDSFNIGGEDSNFLYECVGVYYSSNIQYSVKCSHCCDVYYCDYCTHGDYLFGCAGLRHKKYCILNKQYTKEEYERLFPRIIEHLKKTGEWGQFFSPRLSPFGYNDSMANEYFSLTKAEALEEEFNWNDYAAPKVTGTKKIPAQRLPDAIADIPDDILNWVIECESDGKSFMIIPQELQFYRKNDLPIPHFCPDCRHYKRKARINPRQLWDRQCDKCHRAIKTTYAPERPEKIYCEPCYLKEVY